MGKIRVLAWSERTEPTSVYPNGINGAIADGLRAHDDIEVTTSSLRDAEQGIGDAALDATDVLIWWGHVKHDLVSDERAESIAQRVRSGKLGLIVVHSAILSKPFKALMGTSCSIGGWREDDEWERVHVVMPNHPIAKGVHDFTIPQTEMYSEPFDIPAPDVLVLESRYEGGEYFRSGCCWLTEKGRVFAFSPGHETLPIMMQDEVKTVLYNAVRWVANRAVNE